MLPLNSWGNYPKAQHAGTIHLNWRDDAICFAQCDHSFLPYGQGRSYGDSGLNENGIAILTHRLNRLISFDPQLGIIECESGVTLGEILNFTLPRFWSLPVLPGTKFVSIGGAIANDVHGKNHHRVGTFGNHVLSFELLRSTGERLTCSPTMNADLYRATIGGLGLTGLILSAKIQLKPIINDVLTSENIPFRSIEAFFELASMSEEKYEYTVAWLDCVTSGKHFGRGIFMRANHSSSQVPSKNKVNYPLKVPFYFPNVVLNKHTIKAFNHLYYMKQAAKTGTQLVNFDSFFFPLDSIGNWNKIYGRGGFLQYQCVLPKKNAHHIVDILKMIVAAGQGSFLSVLKLFGNIASPGLLSFPLDGVTLAVDIPFRGAKTLALLTALDDVVMAQGGRVYPAKDARMSAYAFQSYFPEWKELMALKDPNFSSSFWRRVTSNET